MGECTINELIQGMVNAAKKNPLFLRMECDTCPVLDVTNVLRQVYSNVKYAELTIYGDPRRVRVIYKSATRPPAQTVDQIINNWKHGVELERQHCLNDNLYYLVQYPAKLVVKTEGGQQGAPGWLMVGIPLLFGMILLGEKR